MVHSIMNVDRWRLRKSNVSSKSQASAQVPVVTLLRPFIQQQQQQPEPPPTSPASTAHAPVMTLIHVSIFPHLRSDTKNIPRPVIILIILLPFLYHRLLPLLHNILLYPFYHSLLPVLHHKLLPSFTPLSVSLLTISPTPLAASFPSLPDPSTAGPCPCVVPPPCSQSFLCWIRTSPMNITMEGRLHSMLPIRAPTAGLTLLKP